MFLLPLVAALSLDRSDILFAKCKYRFFHAHQSQNTDNYHSSTYKAKTRGRLFYSFRGLMCLLFAAAGRCGRFRGVAGGAGFFAGFFAAGLLFFSSVPFAPEVESARFRFGAALRCTAGTRATDFPFPLLVLRGLGDCSPSLSGLGDCSPSLSGLGSCSSLSSLSGLGPGSWCFTPRFPLPALTPRRRFVGRSPSLSSSLPEAWCSVSRVTAFRFGWADDLPVALAGLAERVGVAGLGWSLTTLVPEMGDFSKLA